MAVRGSRTQLDPLVLVRALGNVPQRLQPLHHLRRSDRLHLQHLLQHLPLQRLRLRELPQPTMATLTLDLAANSTDPHEMQKSEHGMTHPTHG